MITTFIIWQSSLELYASVITGSFLVGISPTDRFHGNSHKLCILLFSKAGKFKTSMARVPYNKLLTNLDSSSRTGKYWPSIVCVRTSLRLVFTATNSDQYSPVRPSRSVSKRSSYISMKIEIAVFKSRGRY